MREYTFNRSLWKASQEGLLAAMEGKEYKDCPYAENTPEWDAWGDSFEQEDLYGHWGGIQVVLHWYDRQSGMGGVW